MTRVDFYLLNQPGPQARQLFACRLAEKAYRLEHTVHIQAPGADDAARLDDLLWTFRDGSFVPHHRIHAGNDDQESPVTIGCGDDSSPARHLLINLCDEVPDFAGAFGRIAELVSADADCKRQGRKRFASYRDSGYVLETHEV